MLDLGWPELLVVALVLIIVVGPKDLPGMLRTFGRTTRKLRSMAGEFRSQFDEALKEAELDDVRQVISEAQQLNPKSILKDVVDPIAEMGKEIKSDLDKTMKEATAPSPSDSIASKPDGDAADEAKAVAKPNVQKKPAKSRANAAAKKKPGAVASRTRKTTAKSQAKAPKSEAKAPATKSTATKRTSAKKPAASTPRRKPAASKSAKSSGDTA